MSLPSSLHSREEFADPGLRSGSAKYRPLIIAGVALGTILFQVYVPQILPVLRYLELPLLVAIYFPLMRRSPMSGLVIGAGIGLLQDALSQNPLGMYGIAKTLLGYAAGSVSQRFDDTNPSVRLILSFVFFLLHQLIYGTMKVALLGQPFGLSPVRTLVEALLNAAVALPFFQTLDKLRLGSAG